MTSRTQALLLAALLALPLVPPPAEAAAAPALETLLNGSLEGSEGAANGYELSGGAEPSPVAEDGIQSVNLARAGAMPSGGALGAVAVLTTHDVELRHVVSFSYSHRVPRNPPPVRLVESLPLDVDGDGATDACLVAPESAPLAASDSWTRRTLDSTTPFRLADASCAGGASIRTLADLQADAAYRFAKVRNASIAALAASGPWPLAPVQVDRVSLLATSSPLIRIAPDAANLCDGASFAKLAAALDCAADGATVLLAPGTHVGSATLSRPVTLCAAGAGASACEAGRTDVVVRGDAARVLTILAPDVTIRGLIVENPGHTALVGPAPALVAVEADRFELRDATLRSAASAPTLGQSRSATYGLLLASGDGARVENVTIQGMPASTGPDDSCAAAPCRTTGIHVASAATRAVVANSTVDLAGARRVHGISSEAAHATLRANTVRIPSSNGENAALHVTGLRAGAVEANHLSATSGRPATGLRALDLDAPVRENVATGFGDAFHLAAAPGATLVVHANRAVDSTTGLRLEGNATAEANRITTATNGVHLTGAATGAATLRSNVLRDASTLLRVGSSVAGATVDARENDWGAYHAGTIRSRITNLGPGTTVDATCYLDADGATRICPPVAGFSWSPETVSWNRTATFTDASTSDRALVARTWTFGDGNTSTQTNPNHRFAAPGTYPVRLDVEDADGTVASATRTVTVVNRAPEFAPLGPYTVQENQSMTFVLAATDADGDALTYRMEMGPADATFDAKNATFRWRPGFDQAGAHVARFVADDTLAATALDVAITVTEGNAPPFLEPIGNRTVSEGELLRFTVRATDLDEQAIRFQAFVRPYGSTFVDHRNGTGTFSWTPNHQQAGTYPLTFEANDGQLETRETIVIQVLDVNRPPVFDIGPNRTIAEASLLQFLVTATDADNDPITFTAPVLPAGATFNTTARRFAWTPNHDQEGVHRVVLNASDGKTNTSAETFIHVTKTNRAPYVDAVPTRAVLVNRTLIFTISGGDPDGDPLVFRAEGLPPGATFDPTYRVFTWRPLAGDIGRHDIRFIADDGVATGSRVGTVNVVENRAPLLDIQLPARFDTDAEAAFRAVADDPETSGAVDIAWDFDAADGIGADRRGSFVTWTYRTPGRYNITVLATDRDGITNTTRHAVEVDDSLRVDLAVLEPVPDFGTSTHARVALHLSDGTPVPFTTVTVTSAYEQSPGAPRLFERTMTVTTDANGMAEFFVPRDLPTLSVPGRHVLDAAAATTTSRGGDPETGSATVVYAIGL